MADQDLWRKNLTQGWQGQQADSWDGEVPLKPIIWSMIAIAVAVLVAFVLNSWLMTFWDGSREVSVSPLLEARERFEHVDPKLQPNPEAELKEMKAELEEQLDSYGWVDPMEKRVHLPVKRGMEIVLRAKAGPETIEPAPDAPIDVEAPAEATER